MGANSNFCTLNPNAMNDSNGTFSAGNTLYTHTNNAWRSPIGTMMIPGSGKWYWEAYQKENLSGNGYPIGIYDMESGLYADKQMLDYPNGAGTKGHAYTAYSNSGTYASRYNAGTETLMTLSIGAAGDVWQIAVDLDNNKLWFGKNNTWDNGGNPSSGTNPSYSGGQLAESFKRWVPITCSYNDSSSENFEQNWGQDSTFNGQKTATSHTDSAGFGEFQYQPPTNFLALCSGNLVTESGVDPSGDDGATAQQHNVVNYTGNGGSNAITGMGFKPDLLFIKRRDSASNGVKIDSSRGANKVMFTAVNDAEVTSADLSSFDNDGFTATGSGSYTANVNNNSATYSAFGWKCNGGTTVTDSSGSISCTRQTNVSGGFSILTYTGNGSGGATLGHGLGKAPEWMICEPRDSTMADVTYAKYMDNGGGSGGYGYIHMSGSDAYSAYTPIWNGTNPSSTLITLGSAGNVNSNGTTYLLYAWTSIPGYSQFGHYRGSGAAKGPMIVTNFRPKSVMMKRTDGSGSWLQSNSTSRPFNDGTYREFYWNSDSSEQTGADSHDGVKYYSNGFQVVGTNAGCNGDGNDYIYMAFGDNPLKTGNAF